MKINKKAETLVSIIIWILIISIVIFWTIKMIEYDKEKSLEYDKINDIFLLETNANNIIRKIKTSDINEKEVFYLYKTGSQILAYTWLTNDYLKYIDNKWNVVINTWTYKWNIYTRLFIVDKDTATTQLIKWWIKELLKK